jgi:hypothetical protein
LYREVQLLLLPEGLAREELPVKAILLMLTAAALTACPGRTAATDLSKIDRSIAKEPAYESKPKYCLVVFGLGAKTRVWLVVDGNVLYADRNSDGDLTGKDERFPIQYGPGKTFPVGTITPRDGNDPVLLVVEFAGREGAETCYVIGCRPQKGKGLRQRTYGRLVFADRPQDAPVVHFGGPLTLTILDWHKTVQERRLVGGDRENQLSILVGTPVFGGKHEAFATVDEWFPGLAGRGTFPVVEVEFPVKDSGAKPITTRATVRA